MYLQHLLLRFVTNLRHFKEADSTATKIRDTLVMHMQFPYQSFLMCIDVLWYQIHTGIDASHKNALI